MSPSDTHSVLATEIRNLRQQLMDSKDSIKAEKDRAIDLERDAEARSSRLLDLQESLTEASSENARLSRSLEQDRLLMSDLRRTNEETKKSTASSESKFNQFMTDKKRDIKEKDEANDHLREEVKRVKKSLSMNILRSVANLREAKVKFTAFSAVKAEVSASTIAKIKAEGEAVGKKFREEYVEATTQLSSER